MIHVCIWSEAFDENDRLEYRALVIAVSFSPIIGAGTRERESETEGWKEKELTARSMAFEVYTYARW